MGWFWGPPGDDKPRLEQQDPLRGLSPDLREFLSKESPVKYNSSNPPESSAPATKPTPTSETAPHSQTGVDPETKVPQESLFQDGRYAYLWKNYRPLSDIENEVKSDAEKIQDVLEGYKYRKAEIGRAALENCALEQWDVNECFRHGGLRDRLTMCRKDNRKFERCYLMQAKFLKALGYMSTFDRPPEVDERIQMHADTLFHKMLKQEAAVEAAKAAGQTVPEFSPLLSTTKKPTATTAPLAAEGKVKPEDMSDKVQAGFNKRLRKLSGEERELEERAIKAEIKAGEEIAGTLSGIYQKQAEERKQRKEMGKETVGDKFTSIFRAR